VFEPEERFFEELELLPFVGPGLGLRAPERVMATFSLPR
jgi:hypothetical protein